MNTHSSPGHSSTPARGPSHLFGQGCDGRDKRPDLGCARGPQACMRCWAGGARASCARSCARAAATSACTRSCPCRRAAARLPLRAGPDVLRASACRLRRARMSRLHRASSDGPHGRRKAEGPKGRCPPHACGLCSASDCDCVLRQASFGLADELRRRCSGAASAALMLSHWERLQARACPSAARLSSAAGAPCSQCLVPPIRWLPCALS